MKCVNCPNGAIYYVADPGANPVAYCSACLPSWLKARADLGQFSLPVQEAPKSKKSTPAPEPEPVAEATDESL